MTYWGHASKGQSQVLTSASICQPSSPSVLDRELRSFRYPVWSFPYYGDLSTPTPGPLPPPRSLWSLIPSSPVVFHGMRCGDSLLDWSTLDIFEFPESSVEPGAQ